MNVNLDHETEVTVWKNGFSLSSATIEALITKAETVDFAIFIFTPDDLATIRERATHVVRDNVLFELGLFIGTLGKERCFIVKPRGVALHFPTDLLGLTPADYDGERSDNNLISAVNAPCVLIKNEIAKLGPVAREVQTLTPARRKHEYNYKLGDAELVLLSKVLEATITYPKATSVVHVLHELRRADKTALSLAMLKLERLGLIEKSIAVDTDFDEYYTLALTEDGMDYALSNLSVTESKRSKEEPDFDDDIPF